MKVTRQVSAGYAKDFPICASVPERARALRPMRIDRHEKPIHYTATTFVRPFEGLEITLRRMEAFGMLVAQTGKQLEGTRFVDILDADEDIIDTIGVTQRGFEYMRRVLRFRREQ